MDETGADWPARPADVISQRCTPAKLEAAVAEVGAVGDVVVVATPAPTAALREVTAAQADRHVAEAAALIRAGELACRLRPQRLTVIVPAGSSWGSVNTAGGAAAAGRLAAWARRASNTTSVSLVGLMPRSDVTELSAAHAGLFEESGLRLLTGGDVESVIQRALLGPPGEQYAAAVDLNRYVRLCQDLAPRTFLAALDGASRAAAVLRPELIALPAAARSQRLHDHVSQVVGDALGLRNGELDPQAGFFDLGMDSVMSLAVRSRLEDDLGVELPSTLTFEYPSADLLAGYLGELLDPAAPDDLGPDSATAAPDDLGPDSATAAAGRDAGAGI